MAIATGLLAGILVGGLALGAAVVLLPPPSAPEATIASPGAGGAPTPSSPGPASPSASLNARPSTVASASSSIASASPSGTADGRDFGIGTVAPGLDLARLGGGTVSLAALRGKPVWVNFMATWCPECRDELPLMQAFEARYQDTGLALVLVDVKEPSAEVASFVKSLGVTLPVALDTDGSAAAAWTALALPVHFWLNAAGVITAGAAGAVPASVMAANLQKILTGVTVTP